MLPVLPPVAPGSVHFASSDLRIVRAFDWAKKEALAYAHDAGDPVGPWYEAALPGRSAFCMRDVAHQAAGAEVLGLTRHNFNMLRKFALGIAKSREWCTFWEIDKWDRPAPVDYQSDENFWYTLPANFDVLDACYRVFLWTGDRRYVDAPEFQNFYTRSLTDYVRTWQLGPKEVMARTVEYQGARGIPSYEERVGGISVGLDTVAAHVAALRSYAGMLRLRGKPAETAKAQQQAIALARLMDDKWWDPTKRAYHAFWTTERRFDGESPWFDLYWDTCTDPAKLAAIVPKYAAVPLAENASQVEDKSYRAEILYRYGYAKEALAQILDLCAEDRDRREYPEVSFSVVGAVARGMMGVQVEWRGPRSFEPVVRTLPALADPKSWAEMRDLPILGTLVSVKHAGNGNAIFENQGPTKLIWRATFRGNHPAILVNGKPRKSRTSKDRLAHPLAYVDVQIPPHSKASARLE